MVPSRWRGQKNKKTKILEIHQKSIKMAPAETTRPLFYFSAHNYARPTRIKPAGEHMFVANVREYQGQRAPGARVVARAAPAIFRFWTITHRKKLKK